MSFFMRKLIFYTVLCNFFLVQSITVAQSDKVLFRIDDKPIRVSEFKKVYEKNLNLVVDEEAKDVAKYLDLYINYKLKVNEAYAIGLDTLDSYKRELNSYKNQLIIPYLQDNELIDRMVKEAYEKMTQEVKVSHILIRFPENATPKDTLSAYHKIVGIRDKIVAGASFDKVAREVSQDPSVKINGGDLGYFSVFRMVYPFEEKSYATSVGQMSAPFKTQFGYHIIKVTGKRKARGAFEVAHILIKDRSIEGKVKIDSLYTKLTNGASFDKIAQRYSQDTSTSYKGGKLPRFEAGSTVEEFEDTVHKMIRANDISKPFQTRYGWHIVKLIKKYPIKTFEEEKAEIEHKIKNSDRIKLSQAAVIDKLKKKYEIKENKEQLALFATETIATLSKKGNEDWIVSIEGEKIPKQKFINFIRFRKNKDIKKSFEAFIDNEVVQYFKNNLVHTNPTYRSTLLEYKEGLLLFELMQRKVWQKATNDTEGLQQYFEKNKEKYKQKELEEVKGDVISDYQKDLENNLINRLKKNSTIEVEKRVLKKLKRIYNN